MPRYYFDTHDGDRLIRDDTGIELEGEREAELEAANGLAGIAVDAVPRGRYDGIAIAVRDESGRDLFKMKLVFEVIR